MIGPGTADDPFHPGPTFRLLRLVVPHPRPTASSDPPCDSPIRGRHCGVLWHDRAAFKNPFACKSPDLRVFEKCNAKKDDIQKAELRNGWSQGTRNRFAVLT